MSVCGQIRDGSVLRLSRPPRCIRAELYLHIVVYLCANCVVSMLRLPMDTKMLVISGIVRLSALVRNRISRIVATMHGICSTITADEEFVLAVLPIAYASLEMNELREAIADPQQGIAISEGLKRDLQYVLGEDQ